MMRITPATSLFQVGVAVSVAGVARTGCEKARVLLLAVAIIRAIP
jgi:hypothetical protein